MRPVSRLAVPAILLLAWITAPGIAAAESIPWEVKNHPNPCLEQKVRCGGGQVLGTYDGTICEILVANCALQAQGKYKPQAVKPNIQLVRLDDEPDACWKYRTDDCSECAASCGACSDLASKCKDQLYITWVKTADRDGQVELVPVKVKKSTGKKATTKKAAKKKPYKKTLIPKKKKYPRKKKKYPKKR